MIVAIIFLLAAVGVMKYLDNKSVADLDESTEDEEIYEIAGTECTKK